MPFGNAAFDRLAYIRLLQRTYSFFTTWETAASRAADNIILSLLRERSRLDALSHDLQFFQALPEHAVMPASYLPQLNEPAKLLGSMYVIEGSTLGGQFIARMLETKLQLAHGNGYSFFVGSGAATGTRWKAFGRYLADWSRANPTETDSIIASARQTFQAYGLWVGDTAPGG